MRQRRDNHPIDIVSPGILRARRDYDPNAPLIIPPLTVVTRDPGWWDERASIVVPSTSIITTTRDVNVFDIFVVKVVERFKSIQEGTAMRYEVGYFTDDPELPIGRIIQCMRGKDAWYPLFRAKSGTKVPMADLYYTELWGY